MYAIYAYIGVVLGVNVGIYGIHGVSGYSDLVLRDAAYGWVLVPSSLVVPLDRRQVGSSVRPGEPSFSCGWAVWTRC